jgi:hypothetical protein
MPALSNPRHERLAQALAAGIPPDEALIVAGYKARGIAARLAGRADVVGRVRELTDGSDLSAVIAGLVPAIHGCEAAGPWIPGTSPGMTAALEASASVTDLPSRPAPTRQWVLERLVDNVERALQLADPKDPATEATARTKYDGSVANRALELLGKELGMFTERTENQHTLHDISDQPLTPDQWAKRHVGDA